MTPDLSIYGETPSAPIAIIATPGAEELAQLIDKRLITLFSESHLGNKLHNGTFILKSDCPRSQTAMQRASSTKPSAAKTCTSFAIRAITV